MGLLGKLIAKKRRQHAFLLNIQGIKSAKRGLYKEAQNLFEQAINIAPDLPHPRISLSNLLLRDGRYSQAKLQLNKALALNPDKRTQLDALNNLASVHFAQKCYDKAIELLKEAISVYNPDHEIYYNMGIAHEQLGNWEDALYYLRQSNAFFPTLKAQSRVEHVKQRMWQSSKTKHILDSYAGFNVKYPECKCNPLSPEELATLKNFVSPEDRLVFFVGAGISYPYPSCLPMASQILQQIFHFIFELDRRDICEILQVNNEITEAEAYAKLSRDLMQIPDKYPDSKCFLPFEATFQVLHDVLGFCAVKFVDLLNQGKPNLYHEMLAYALKRGHTVITTNFDKHIEDAYGNSLGVLVTDKEYQESLDNNQIDGVLAKIHGDMIDYNSLVLTLEGVSISCDSSEWHEDKR